MAEQKKRSRKGVKKTFFEVKTPLTASKIQLYGYSIDDLDGTIVRLDLTRSLRGKNFELRLRVTKDNEELRADPIGLGLMGSYIRRMMRSGVDYVEDSFVAECKDGKVKIKPFMIARNKISRAVRRALRNNARKFLEEHLKNRGREEIFTEIISNKLQKELFLKSKKIYPLALCEIRMFELVNEKKHG